MVSFSKLVRGRSSIVVSSALICLIHFKGSAGVQRSLTIHFSDFKPSKDCIARLNVFVEGGTLSTLSSDTALAGSSQLIFHYTDNGLEYRGIGEVNIETFGAAPIILGDMEKVVALSKDDLQRDFPPSSTLENKVLAQFMPIYRGYEVMLDHHKSELVSPFGVLTSDRAAYSRFATDYWSFRKQFNLFFKYAQANFPQSYVATTLSKLFVQDIPNNPGFQDIAVNYFTRWDFSELSILCNPLFDRQIDVYNFLSASPLSGNDSDRLDHLYTAIHLSRRVDQSVRDHINSKIIIGLFQNNHDGTKDQVLEYFYRHWISQDLESCNEEAEASDNRIFQKAFYKRLGNLSRVQEGLILPAVSGNTSSGERYEMGAHLDKKPFTILLLWSSSCPHCEDYIPHLVAFAKEHVAELQIIAYSIDKANNEANWIRNVSARTSISNWQDIAEIHDLTSKGVSNICYMGTPSVFLLDRSGKIRSRNTDLKILEQLIANN